MDIILINSSAIYALQEETLQNNPILVFSSFYTAFDLDVSVDFSEWLNTYILPSNINDMNKKEIQRLIRTTLTSNEQIRRATFKLYPMQFNITEENYPFIKNSILEIYKNKTGKELKLLNFNELKKVYTSNVGRVQYV